MPPVEVVFAEAPAQEVDDAVVADSVEVDQARVGVAKDDVALGQLLQRLVQAGGRRAVPVAPDPFGGDGTVAHLLDQLAEAGKVGPRLLDGPKARHRATRARAGPRR